MRGEVEKMKRRRAFAILLTLVLALAGCGAKSASDSAYYGVTTNAPVMNESAAQYDSNGYWAPDAPMEMEDAGTDARAALPDGVKMIYRANLELETTEFDKATADVKTLTQSLGGYFEEQGVYNYSSGYRSASYTIRVPAERFEDFLSQIGDLCHITHQTQSAEDVSEYYYDMESRLETAKIKLDRLQDLLSRAEEMEDIITLEGAISDTEYQIESLSGEKRHYDSLIGYSTIYVSLKEVYRVTETETAPLTFGQRIGVAFRDGLRNFGDAMEDFIEWLAYSWLTLLVIAAIVVVIIKLVKRLRAKRAAGNNGAKKKLLGRKSKDASAPTPEKDKED